MKMFTTLMAVILLAPATGISQPLAPIELGSAANFAVLAGSLISNIPTSAVKGDIGLSPSAGSNITGMTIPELTGTMYTVDATGPAGSVEDATGLSAAKGALTVAFNFAAGLTPIPTGPFLNPGSGNIGGLTLVPGLYKFTAAASITGTDVTLNGSATDVWVFQIASNLTVGNGISVILTGGATASNIFWQVGTSATLGTGSVFSGTIMADQSISMNGGASLNGRALARVAAVTLSSNAINRPSLVTSVSDGAREENFALLQNYPNPFNPSTIIGYNIGKAGIVSLKLYNIIGGEVATLVHKYQEAGAYTVEFSPIHNSATDLSSGIYFYRLDAGNLFTIKKMILVK